MLMTISRHTIFGSTDKLDNMKHSHILEHFRLLIGANITRGFKVTIKLADN